MSIYGGTRRENDTVEFRALEESEIELRVGTISEKGCSLLLFKNARVDMNILDERGLLWQRRHYECKGNLFCSVGIKIGDEWVWRDDCGSESNTEKEKGEASDSFKRACVNWGIGRELYTAPFIWIPAQNVTIKDNKGRMSTYDKFAVEKIAYDDQRRISGLAIINQTRKERVFVWQRG
jgi:hypothetical protein